MPGKRSRRESYSKGGQDRRSHQNGNSRRVNRSLSEDCIIETEWARVEHVGSDSAGRRFGLFFLVDDDKRRRHAAHDLKQSETVYCPSSVWGDSEPNKLDFVRCRLKWRDERGYQVLGIEEQRPAVGKARGIDWGTLRHCPECGKKRLLPDYPTGLYVADEVVSGTFEKDRHYGHAIGLGPMDFDDDLDEELLALLAAGRLMDAGDTVQAAKQVASIWPIKETAYGDVESLRTRIMCRLGSAFGRMSGDEFVEFAHLLEVAEGVSSLSLWLLGFPREWTAEYAIEHVLGTLSAAGLEIDRQDVSTDKSNSGRVKCLLRCDEKTATWIFDNSKKGIGWARVALLDR